jgi:hypothetical protein
MKQLIVLAAAIMTGLLRARAPRPGHAVRQWLSLPICR